MNFPAISFHASAPIYLQIADDIKSSIVSGELTPGQRLQSVRDLASQFEVNPNTVQRALSLLESEGLLRAERTAGRFITEDHTLISHLKHSEADAIISRFIQQMAQLGYDAEEMTKRLQDALQKGVYNE